MRRARRSMQQISIEAAQYLDYTQEEPCGKSEYSILLFESLDPTSISMIHHNKPSRTKLDIN